jgi:hypothetical protein
MEITEYQRPGLIAARWESRYTDTGKPASSRREDTTRMQFETTIEPSALMGLLER